MANLYTLPSDVLLFCIFSLQSQRFWAQKRLNIKKFYYFRNIKYCCHEIN